MKFTNLTQLGQEILRHISIDDKEYHNFSEVIKDNLDIETAIDELIENELADFKNYTKENRNGGFVGEGGVSILPTSVNYEIVEAKITPNGYKLLKNG